MTEQAETMEKPVIPEGEEYEPLKKAYKSLQGVRNVVRQAVEIHYLGYYKKLHYYLLKTVDVTTGGKIAWLFRIAPNGFLKTMVPIPYGFWEKLVKTVNS